MIADYLEPRLLRPEVSVKSWRRAPPCSLPFAESNAASQLTEILWFEQFKLPLTGPKTSYSSLTVRIRSGQPLLFPSLADSYCTRARTVPTLLSALAVPSSFLKAPSQCGG